MAYFTKNILRMEGRPGNDPRGKIWVNPDHITSPYPWMRVDCHIYNYNIDGNILKEEHKKWLLEQLCPIVQLGRYHVELHAHTSSTGEAEYNRGLSLQRVLLLKEFLLEKGGLSEAQVPGERMRAFGERYANPMIPEDEFDRGVNILIRPGLLLRASVPIRKPVPEQDTPLEPQDVEPEAPENDRRRGGDDPPQPGKAKEFRARYNGGLEAGVGSLGYAQHWFEVYAFDDATEKRQFLLDGPLVQVPGAPAGAATEGSSEWFSFTCPLDNVDQLAGKWGSITGAGGGSTNPFYLSIPDCGVFLKPFPTGKTLGIGADKMTGKFTRNNSYKPPDAT